LTMVMIFIGSILSLTTTFPLVWKIIARVSIFLVTGDDGDTSPVFSAYTSIAGSHCSKEFCHSIWECSLVRRRWQQGAFLCWRWGGDGLDAHHSKIEFVSWVLSLLKPWLINCRVEVIKIRSKMIRH
jgi:hypothetical protein